MNYSRPIFTCLLVGFLIRQAAAEDRKAEIDTLLSAYQLAQARQITDDWLAGEEKQGESADLALALESWVSLRLLQGDKPADLRGSVERALTIRQRIVGPDDPSLAHDINLLGAISFRATDYRAAIAEFQRALTLETQPTLTQAETLAGLGQATGFAGDPRAGIEMVKRALAIREANCGPRSIQVAETLNLSATLSYQANDLPPAEEAFLKARQIVTELYGPDHFLAAQVDGGLVSIYKDRAEFSKARALSEHVVRVFEAVLGPEHPRLVVQYNNLGLTIKETGDLPAARRALEAALRISEKANGPESTTTATVLGNLGIALKESGDLEGARDAYERALAIQERRLGPDHAMVGAVLFSLGSLLADMGDAVNGKKRLERALEITEKSKGPASVRSIQIMDRLGLLLRSGKDYAGARRVFERAWDESRRANGDSNVRTAAALASLAGIHEDMGDFSGSRQRYREALSVQERELGPTHYYTLETVYAFARMEQAAGSFEAALELFNRVSEQWRKQFGANYPALADSVGHKAQCLNWLGRRAEALDSALESAQIRRTNLEIAAHASSEREALLYAAKEGVGLDLALRLAATAKLPPESVRDIWDAVIRERALVLDEMAERHAVPEAPDVAAQASSVKALREELATAVVRGPESNQSAYADRLARLQSRLDEAERGLASRSRRFLDHQVETRKGFDAVRESLPRGSALVAYAKYSGRYLAFVLRAGETLPHVVPLAKAAEIDADVTAWRAEIDRERDSAGRAQASNLAAYRSAGTTLRRAIWDPVASQVAASKAVYVVGDGAIQSVAFLALPAGVASYLVESGPEIRLISSERDISEPRRSAGGALLAVGGPAFDKQPVSQGSSRLRGSSSHCEAFSQLHFGALPGSAEEARAVAGLGRQFGLQTVMLRGNEATKGAFMNAAPGKTIVHVATHGFFLNSQCPGHASALESPLLRAGLAFAGANRRPEQDGILTAEEVASLEFESAEMVVLSGCDTGAGEVQTGEGVLGLRRAFRIAGARTLVMSLWPVDDQETRRWMIALYGAYLGKKLGAAAAVRSASQEALRQRRVAGQSTHPFYWAGFIALGN